MKRKKISIILIVLFSIILITTTNASALDCTETENCNGSMYVDGCGGFACESDYSTCQYDAQCQTWNDNHYTKYKCNVCHEVDPEGGMHRETEEVHEKCFIFGTDVCPF